MKTQSDRGQSLIEFALVLPLLILIAFGVVEVSYVLFDQHIVTKLTREGSNLISRNTTLGDAMTAMRTMSSAPVDLDDQSRIIFSVVRNVPTVGAANYNRAILAQRYAYGNLSATQHDPDARRRLVRRRARVCGGQSGQQHEPSGDESAGHAFARRVALRDGALHHGIRR